MVRTIAGGPAATSKLLHTDDRIMGIGEDEEIVDIEGWSWDDVVDLIRGPKGTTVQLKILSADAAADRSPEVVSIVRG